MISQLPEFVAQYLATLMWSSEEENDPMDLSQLSPTALACAQDECRSFLVAHGELVSQAVAVYGLDGVAHDLALTRNNHGAGFWDGELPEPLGQQLTSVCETMGQCQPYRGDDGLIYFMGG